MSTADTGAQLNFGDLTPHLTYGIDGSVIGLQKSGVNNKK
jgi:hypothetical protein